MIPFFEGVIMGNNNTRQGYAKAPQTGGLLFRQAKSYPTYKTSGVDGNVFFALLRPLKMADK